MATSEWFEDTSSIFCALAAVSNLLSIAALIALNLNLIHAVWIFLTVATLLLPTCYASVWLYAPPTTGQVHYPETKDDSAISDPVRTWIGVLASLLSCFASVQKSVIATICIFGMIPQRENRLLLIAALALIYVFAALELWVVFYAYTKLREVRRTGDDRSRQALSGLLMNENTGLTRKKHTPYSE
ncbi:hypothetical protein FRC09_014078 [Ceratobasidium sp. 395]|nr:hypothetical protein FRC09_014078 [Ceratobasidium sp. 395]